MALKWRKLPNRFEWKSCTGGIRIVWNPWFKIFQIDRDSTYTYAHAKSLKDAKEIAESWRFKK